MGWRHWPGGRVGVRWPICSKPTASPTPLAGGFPGQFLILVAFEINIRANDARFEQALETYRNTVLIAVQEVQDAAIAVIKNREREGYLRSSVEASARAAELAQLQYKNGEIDYQSVLDSLRELVQKQQTHTQVKGDITTNLVALYKALGEAAGN